MAQLTAADIAALREVIPVEASNNREEYFAMVNSIINAAAANGRSVHDEVHSGRYYGLENNSKAAQENRANPQLLAQVDEAIARVQSGERDPTNGATHFEGNYFLENKGVPAWTKGMTPTEVGATTFYAPGGTRAAPTLANVAPPSIPTGRENMAPLRGLDEPRQTAQGWVAPVDGTFIGGGRSFFGADRSGGARHHAGTDWQAANGSVARSMLGGTVLYTGRHSGYGAVADILHDDGSIGRYAVHGSTGVREGQRVEAGDPIGKIAQGHLHFELVTKDSPIYDRMAKGGDFVSTQWWGRGTPVTTDPEAYFGIPRGTPVSAGEYFAALKDPFGVSTARAEGTLPPLPVSKPSNPPAMPTQVARAEGSPWTAVGLTAPQKEAPAALGFAPSSAPPLPAKEGEGGFNWDTDFRGVQDLWEKGGVGLSPHLAITNGIAPALPGVASDVRFWRDRSALNDNGRRRDYLETERRGLPSMPQAQAPARSERQVLGQGSGSAGSIFPSSVEFGAPARSAGTLANLSGLYGTNGRSVPTIPMRGEDAQTNRINNDWPAPAGGSPSPPSWMFASAPSITSNAGPVPSEGTASGFNSGLPFPTNDRGAPPTIPGPRSLTEGILNEKATQPRGMTIQELQARPLTDNQPKTFTEWVTQMVPQTTRIPLTMDQKTAGLGKKGDVAQEAKFRLETTMVPRQVQVTRVAPNAPQTTSRQSSGNWLTNALSAVGNAASGVAGLNLGNVPAGGNPYGLAGTGFSYGILGGGNPYSGLDPHEWGFSSGVYS